MSRKNPAKDVPSRNAAARLRLLFCVAAAALLCPAAARAQTQEPTPAPTPVVRPRTVRPKSEAPRPSATPTQSTPAPTPAQPTPTQTNPAPTQPNTAQPQASPAQAAPAQVSPAQPEADDEAVDENDVVRVESNIVLIPASVVDFRGRAITDLKADDFELKIDGELKPIGDVSRAETPVNIAFLFDNSASLSAAREFEKQAAVRFFQSVVRPIDRAAVYSISTTPTLSQGLTNDVNRLVRTVQNFGKPDGATALFDALAQAADYMRPVAGRKVLVLVSDGTDTVSDATFEDAINRALLAECQVYVVQTRQVEDPSLHDTVSEQRMYKLSEQTGGAVFIPQSIEDLDAVFSQISLDLSQQYLLSYSPQDERKDKFFRFISLRVKTRQNLRVRARKGFYPTAAQVGTMPPQMAQGLSVQPTRAEYAASPAPTRAPESSNAQRREVASKGSPASARRDSSSSRKPGPDGPDTDDRPKPAVAAAEETEGQASFTLKTVASATTPTSNVVNVPANTPTPEPARVAPTPAPATTTTAANAPEAASSNSLFNASPTTVTKPEQPAASQPPAAESRPSPTPSQTPLEATSPAPAGEPARPKAPVSAGLLNSKAVSLPKPVYPSNARSVGAQGKVVVELTIDETGKVTKARALSGHPLLQKAAVAAALQARFSPTVLSGAPVPVTGTISYSFLLQ